MDFSSTETWIDLLVVFVAIIAVIVGAITVARMFKSEEENEAKEEINAKTKPETKKSQPNGKGSKPSSKSVFEKIAQNSPKNKEAVADKIVNQNKPQLVSNFTKNQEINTQASQVKTVANGASSRTKELKNEMPPKLEAIQLSLDSPERLLLKLKNTGQKLIYKKIKTGDHNELSIRYQPPERKVHAVVEAFPTNSIMKFTLSGPAIISKTYQFTIYYGDMNGNLYTQIIAGMGKEYPIVDKPRKIA